MQYGVTWLSIPYEGVKISRSRDIVNGLSWYYSGLPVMNNCITRKATNRGKNRISKQPLILMYLTDQVIVVKRIETFSASATV